MEKWTCMGVETSIPWPAIEKKWLFESHELILRPETETIAPSIAFEYGSKGITAAEAQTIIRRFMSALVWMEGLSLKETFCIESNTPVGIGKSIFRNAGPNAIFDHRYLPAPIEASQKLALALYREAICNNSVFYKFLGFVKIINIIVDGTGAHIKWINSNLCHITEPRALEVISSLKAKKKRNIGKHIYESGRCAVAHANIKTKEVVDPDSSNDLKRLTGELPLIQALAIVAIEQEFKIPSRRTVYKEHAYELKGFKEKFQNDFIKEIVDGVPRPVLPKEIGMNLCIRIRDKNPYESMNNLQILKAQMNKGTLLLLLTTPEKAVQFSIGLDFKNNRILMNPYAGAEILYFGTKQSAISIRSFYQFMKDLFMNGKLQIEEAGTDYLLGYKDAFIPHDIDVSGTIANFENAIASLEVEINKN